MKELIYARHDFNVCLLQLLNKSKHLRMYLECSVQ